MALIEKEMTSDIIKKLTAIKNTSEVTSELVLALVQRVEAQRSKKALLATI